MWLNGFGFPRYRGGLMVWADTIGVAEVYRQIQARHQQYGERWAPASLLRRRRTGTPLPRPVPRPIRNDGATLIRDSPARRIRRAP
jgi:3-hydroxyacyl-CoA dehydrogenase